MPFWGQGRALVDWRTAIRHILIATLIVTLSAVGLPLGLSAADTVERTVAPHTTGVERAVSC